MTVHIPAALIEFVERLRLLPLARSSVKALIFIGLMTLVVAFLEWREGAATGRYRTRAFFNDVVYSLFYRGGFYSIFIAAAFTNAVESRLGFLRFHLISDLPLPVAVVIFWIVADFLAYWLHRLQHQNRFLWAFHSIHHAPEHLSFLTSYRLHPIEQLLANLIMVGPLLVLGVPTTSWLPVVVIQNGLEFAQHAELNWRYGRLYPLIVSPQFHAFHHSADPAHIDRNFGKIFSAWDFIFGTAVKDHDRPVRFGIHDFVIPERLSAQMLAPFRLLSGPPAVSSPAQPMVAPAASPTHSDL